MVADLDRNVFKIASNNNHSVMAVDLQSKKMEKWAYFTIRQISSNSCISS